jgi:hypothetical protein
MLCKQRLTHAREIDLRRKMACALLGVIMSALTLRATRATSDDFEVCTIRRKAASNRIAANAPVFGASFIARVARLS